MIFVAIGANLSGPEQSSPLSTCEAAIAALQGLAGLRLAGASRWYESAPMPPSGQPNYINGVVMLDGDVAPEALLADLHRIEQTFGRVRGAANAARTLDLDIVAIDGIVRDAPDPILPHPRMHLRAFVLAPLLDVAPGWMHPVLNRTASALLAALPEQGVFALAKSTPSA